MRSGSDIIDNYMGPLMIALRSYPQLIIYGAVFVILKLYDAVV